MTTGILEALAKLRAQPEGQGAVDAVMIGTTHFINAVVQRRNLTKVAAIRIGWPIERNSAALLRLARGRRGDRARRHLADRGRPRV